MSREKLIKEKEDLVRDRMLLERDVMTIKEQLDTADERASRDPKYASKAWRIRARDSLTYKKRNISDINIRVSEIDQSIRDCGPVQSSGQAMVVLRALARKTQEFLAADEVLASDDQNERLHDRFDMKLDELKEAFQKVCAFDAGLVE
jgi:predicted transcriptional regulator of viral defense system